MQVSAIAKVFKTKMYIAFEYLLSFHKNENSSSNSIYMNLCKMYQLLVVPDEWMTKKTKTWKNEGNILFFAVSTEL